MTDITLSFSTKEMKAFLEKLGYEFRSIERTDYSGGDAFSKKKTVEIAYKGDFRKINKHDYLYYYTLDVEIVFTKELKAKLLNL